MLSQKFKVLKHLGSGSQAEVKLVQNIEDGEQFACKMMKTRLSGGEIDDQLFKDVENEVQIVNSLNHNNIYKVKGVGKGDFDPLDGDEPYQVLYILMEYAPNGELFDLVHQSGALDVRVARHYFIQLLDAINYLHNGAKVCHRDLKPENILVDENYNLKLADFGFATELKGEDNSYVLHDYKGTLGYMPPEQHILKAYTGKGADMFASAVILFLMVTQCQPFEKAVGEDKYYRLIATKKSHIYWKIFDKVVQLSDELKDLLMGMLEFDPSKRLTMEQVLAHPWVLAGTPSQDEVHAQMKAKKEAFNLNQSTASTSTD